MKTILLISAIVISMSLHAQISKVTLQASGLTCSMCSNAINKALKKIDFVDKVNADIKTYNFDITFKRNANIDFDLIRQKVERAGFAVAGFVVTVDCDNVEVKNSEAVIDGKRFLFINTNDQFLNGTKHIKLLDKGFVSSQEFRASDFSYTAPAVYHVSI